ncbi:hypothetical protein FGB62_62g225 [Gracilaria domingensis]|nr:hypothetical protein FGB62_62g225 [Gracilaria domingensis]
MFAIYESSSLSGSEEAHGSVLFDGAAAIVGEANVTGFLQRTVEVKKKKENVSVLVGAFAGRGQSRAHENIRKNMFSAFCGATSYECPLNLRSASSIEARKVYARDLFNEGTHRVDNSFKEAWKAACFAARLEAVATAQSSKANLTGHVLFHDLPNLDDIYESTESAQISLFSLAFVSIKVG